MSTAHTQPLGVRPQLILLLLLLHRIERVWCCVKNEIAERPAHTMSELDARLRLNFLQLVTPKVLRSTYRQSLEWEDKYFEEVEEEDPDIPDDPEGEEDDEAGDLDGEHVAPLPLDGPTH